MFNFVSESRIRGQKAELLVEENCKNSKCFKFIFIDIEMPEQDGWVTVKNIKEILTKYRMNSVLIACSGDSIDVNSQQFK